MSRLVEATEADSETIVRFLHDMVLEVGEFPPDLLTAFLRLLNALFKKTCIGFFSLSMRTGKHSAPVIANPFSIIGATQRFYFGAFYIAPSHRGKGRMQAIYAQLRDWAKSKNSHHLFCLIHKTPAKPKSIPQSRMRAFGRNANLLRCFLSREGSSFLNIHFDNLSVSGIGARDSIDEQIPVADHKNPLWIFAAKPFIDKIRHALLKRASLFRKREATIRLGQLLKSQGKANRLAASRWANRHRNCKAFCSPTRGSIAIGAGTVE